MRFLFGAGEAGAFPNIARAVSKWFKAGEQGRAMSVSFVGLAVGLQTTTISAAWAVCLDVGRRYAGAVTGLMNTIGNIGGAIAPLAMSYAVTRFGSWTLPFYVMAAVFILGVVMWLLVDPRRSVLMETLSISPS